MLATSTTSALSPAEGCTYADADKNNGWGWNPFTRKSCKPTANICDYADAPRYKKWGWNATTETSCEPLADDSDADNSDADNSDATATKKTRESFPARPPWQASNIFY